MKILRGLIIVLTLALVVLIIWAMRTGDFSAAGAWLTGDPWGIVTLFDLYFGFFLSAIIILTFERNKAIAVLWILPIPFLGNVWTAIWFILRLKALQVRLRPAER